MCFFRSNIYLLLFVFICCFCLSFFRSGYVLTFYQCLSCWPFGPRGGHLQDGLDVPVRGPTKWTGPKKGGWLQAFSQVQGLQRAAFEAKEASKRHSFETCGTMCYYIHLYTIAIENHPKLVHLP